VHALVDGPKQLANELLGLAAQALVGELLGVLEEEEAVLARRVEGDGGVEARLEVRERDGDAVLLRVAARLLRRALGDRALGRCRCGRRRRARELVAVGRPALALVGHRPRAVLAHLDVAVLLGDRLVADLGGRLARRVVRADVALALPARLLVDDDLVDGALDVLDDAAPAVTRRRVPAAPAFPRLGARPPRLADPSPAREVGVVAEGGACREGEERRAVGEERARRDGRRGVATSGGRREERRDVEGRVDRAGLGDRGRQVPDGEGAKRREGEEVRALGDEERARRVEDEGRDEPARRCTALTSLFVVVESSTKEEGRRGGKVRRPSAPSSCRAPSDQARVLEAHGRKDRAPCRADDVLGQVVDPERLLGRRDRHLALALACRKVDVAQSQSCSRTLLVRQCRKERKRKSERETHEVPRQSSCTRTCPCRHPRRRAARS